MFARGKGNVEGRRKRCLRTEGRVWRVRGQIVGACARRRYEENVGLWEDGAEKACEWQGWFPRDGGIERNWGCEGAVDGPIHMKERR